MPHDFYHIPDGVPHMHHHDPAHYVVPSYGAHQADDELPVLSTIGRGPRGHGIKVEEVEGPEGWSVKFLDDVTGEVLYQSPNVIGDTITCVVPDHRPAAGEVIHVFFYVHHQGAVTEYDLPIPPGVYGSRVYLLEDVHMRTPDDTYTTNYDDLNFYGQKEWEFHWSGHKLEANDDPWEFGSKPLPRVNDIVALIIQDGLEQMLAFGTIEAVENEKIVFTCRTFLRAPSLTLGENGHWFVNGVDTGQMAQGEKGDKGEIIAIRTEQVSYNKPARVYDESEDPSRAELVFEIPEGKPGDKPKILQPRVQQLDPDQDAYVHDLDPSPYVAMYEFGIPKAKPADIQVGDVESAPFGEEPGLHVHWDDEQDCYVFNFTIPQGEPGQALYFHTGWYNLEDLPDFDETPVNHAFCVRDPEDDRYDLYIRGQIPMASELGGPWVVVEDWQGPSGFSVRYVTDDYLMPDEVGESVEIPADEYKDVFTSWHHLLDGDLIIDSNGSLGYLTGADDDLDTLTVTKLADLHASIKPSEQPSLNGVPLTPDTNFADINPDYNDLQNKPAINGHEVLPDSTSKSLELYKDLFLGVNPVNPDTYDSWFEQGIGYAYYNDTLTNEQPTPNGYILSLVNDKTGDIYQVWFDDNGCATHYRVAHSGEEMPAWQESKPDLDIPTFHLAHDPAYFEPDLGSETRIPDSVAQEAFDPYANIKPGSIFLDENGILSRFTGMDGDEYLFETVGSIAVGRITEEEIDELLKNYHPSFSAEVESITEPEIDELLEQYGTTWTPIPDPDIDNLFDGEPSSSGPNTGGNDQSDLDIGSIPNEAIDDLFGQE